MKAIIQEKLVPHVNHEETHQIPHKTTESFAAVLASSTDNKSDIIHGLQYTIQMLVDNLMKAKQTVTFEQAAQESVNARRYRRPSTVADLKSFTRRMMQFGHLAARPLREISVEECLELLNTVFGHSAHSYRKAKMILHSVFHYGQKRGWCDMNPAKVIESPPVVEERINILSTRQVNALVKTCQKEEFRSMEPAIYLMLWCGIRPGEVRRLRWIDIDPKEKVVYIESFNSKTGGARAVPLRGKAITLCRMRKNDADFIAPRNWNRLWKRLRVQAGLRNWQQDALRHTFASFHLKHFHNLHQLQEEMGHRDANLLRTRYLNLRNVSSISAGKFFHS